MKEDKEEADKDIDMGEAPSTRDLAPEQALVLPKTLLAMAGIWVGGRGDQVARLAVSSRAQGKVPTIQAE